MAVFGFYQNKIGVWDKLLVYIYIGSNSKAMADREKKRERQKYKNLNISRTKRAFQMKKKPSFIVFEKLSFGEKQRTQALTSCAGWHFTLDARQLHNGLDKFFVPRFCVFETLAVKQVNIFNRTFIKSFQRIVLPACFNYTFTLCQDIIQ